MSLRTSETRWVFSIWPVAAWKRRLNCSFLSFSSSSDGMTADIYPFDATFLSRVATRIVNEVQGINRVVYDYTSKPPGTIEWE